MFKENHPGLGKDFFAVSHQSSSQFAAPLLLLSRTSQPYYNSRGYCGSQICSAHSHHHITIRSGRHINCIYIYIHSLCLHMYVHMQVYVGMCRYRLIHTCKCYRCDYICVQYSMHMYIIYIYIYTLYILYIHVCP